MSDRDLARSRDIAAQSGGWTEVKRGERVRIIDVEGSQIADTFAVSSADKSEFLSVQNTRAALRRLFPKIGEAFYTNRMRPILTLVEDTSRRCPRHALDVLQPDTLQGNGRRFASSQLRREFPDGSR